jgi:hypothetical protein
MKLVFVASLLASSFVTLAAHADDKPPLELAKTRYLYAGGHVDDAVEGQRASLR